VIEFLRGDIQKKKKILRGGRASSAVPVREEENRGIREREGCSDGILVGDFLVGLAKRRRRPAPACSLRYRCFGLFGGPGIETEIAKLFFNIALSSIIKYSSLLLYKMFSFNNCLLMVNKYVE
jgi:hypothetical protein